MNILWLWFDLQFGLASLTLLARLHYLLIYHKSIFSTVLNGTRVKVLPQHQYLLILIFVPLLYSQIWLDLIVIESNLIRSSKSFNSFYFQGLISLDLNLSWRRPLSYRNWFLNHNGPRHERVKQTASLCYYFNKKSIRVLNFFNFIFSATLLPPTLAEESCECNRWKLCAGSSLLFGLSSLSIDDISLITFWIIDQREHLWG